MPTLGVLDHGVILLVYESHKERGMKLHACVAVPVLGSPVRLSKLRDELFAFDSVSAVFFRSVVLTLWFRA